MGRVGMVAWAMCAGCGRYGFQEHLSSDAGAEIQTIFGDAVPPGYAEGDPAAIEVGLRFQSDVPGTILAIRFFRNVPTPSGYIVHLWSETGELLGIGGLVSNSHPLPGWQRAELTAPFAATQSVTYVATYFTSSGQYAFEQNGLESVKRSGDLTGLINGVFHYGTGDTFPTDVFDNLNYFVDVEFRASSAAGR